VSFKWSITAKKCRKDLYDCICMICIQKFFVLQKTKSLFDIGLFSFIFLYLPFFFYFWYWPLPYLFMHEESLSAFKRSTTKKKKIIPFLHPKDFILCTIVCKYNRRIAVKHVVIRMIFFRLLKPLKWFAACVSTFYFSFCQQRLRKTQ